MFSKVEEIMKKAGKSIQGKRWHVSYPGQLSFHPDPKYLSKFPILSEMRWLLPLLNSSNRRLSSSICETWLLSHKMVIDKRILYQLWSRWKGSREQCESVVKAIQEAVRNGIRSMARLILDELTKSYSKVRLQGKAQTVESSESDTDIPSRIPDNPKSNESSLGKRKHKMIQSYKCEGAWCQGLEQSFFKAPNRVKESESKCSRCAKLVMVESFIREFCGIAVADPSIFDRLLPICFEKSGAVSKDLSEIWELCTCVTKISKETKVIAMDCFFSSLRNLQSIEQLGGVFCSCKSVVSRNKKQECLDCNLIYVSKCQDKKICNSIYCKSIHSSVSKIECSICEASTHRNPACLGSTASLLKKDHICMKCSLIAFLHRSMRTTPGEAQVVQINAPQIQFDFPMGDQDSCYDSQVLSESELRKIIISYFSENQNMHWYKAVKLMEDYSTRMPEILLSSVIQNIDLPMGIIPAVGPGSGVVLSQNNFESMMGNNMVDDCMFEQALALVCSFKTVFRSSLKAACFSPLAYVQMSNGYYRRQSRVHGEVVDRIDKELTAALQYVDILFVPINIENKHWHICVVCREQAKIILFDPFHFSEVDMMGNPELAVIHIKEYISYVSDSSSLFADVWHYSVSYAHEEISHWQLPWQHQGNGCALHCLSFAANMLSGKHVQITDSDTQVICSLFRILLNTSESFGPVCLHSSQAVAYTLPTNIHALTASSSVSAVTHPLPINVQTLTAMGHPLSDINSCVIPARQILASNEAMQEPVSSQVEEASTTSFFGQTSQKAFNQYPGDGMKHLGTRSLSSDGKQYEFCNLF